MRGLDTYILADSQLNYQFDVRLPYSELSGLFDGAAESVWNVRIWHNMATGAVATRDNYTRNILRTPANSKLRMEDKRGEEHIKLATEYGKTQLKTYAFR